MSESELVSADRMRQTARSCGWTMEELAARYLDAARKDLDEVAHALAARHLEDAGRVAHGLAGASEMAGIPGMGAVLRRLEQTARAGDLEGALALARDAEARLGELRRVLAR